MISVFYNTTQGNNDILSSDWLYKNNTNPIENTILKYQ